ncbi:MAG TPA: histidine phosphatase family protein [Solirubrobacter sp.]|nr:histidine phosphatase family protein [Solirubrobacter sp.]
MIFFTRHGESVANVADREFRARPEDADSLSPRGWEQARGVGERLRGEGIEVILASHYRRAQETATAIGEVLGVAVETDPDLHEVRQADAYYESAPEYGDTGTISWMPTAPRDYARPGAESFDAILARVDRVQERLSTRDETVLCVSHWGFLHFFLGRTIFRDEFAPHHLPALFRISHANTGITIFEQRENYVIDGVTFDGLALKTWNDQAHL